MLGKLIKYDFKAMARTMVPIYISLLALTLIFSGMVRLHLDEGFVFTIFAILFVFTLIASMFASVVFVVGRFINGLLKNEGYLSFALPVDTATHIAAKVINAIIWALLEGLMLCVCLLIMGAVMGSVREVALFFKEVFNAFGLIEKDVLLAALKMIAIVILEMIASICLIYAALAVGHMFGRNQKMIAVAFLIAVCIARSFLLTTIIKSLPDEAAYYMHVDDIILIILPIIFAGLYSTLTWFILDRKLNLE